MNIQFAVKASGREDEKVKDQVYLIEVNPRASRTVPFVAKAIGVPVAKIAARVMAGEKLADLPSISTARIDYVGGEGSCVPLGALSRASIPCSHRK